MFWYKNKIRPRLLPIGKFYYLFAPPPPEIQHGIAFIPSVLKRAQRWRVSWITSLSAKLGLVTLPSEMQKNGEMQEGGVVRLLQIYHYEPTLLHLTEKITTYHVKILLFTREYTKWHLLLTIKYKMTFCLRKR